MLYQNIGQFQFLSFSWFVMSINVGVFTPDSLDPDPRSRFKSIRIQFNVVSREVLTARRLPSFHCSSGSHALSRNTGTQPSTHLGSESRPCGAKMVFKSGSMVPCGELGYVIINNSSPEAEPSCLWLHTATIK